MVWQTDQKLQRGKYEIIKVLGRGGFGITYHARHIPLNTEVVIKTPDLLQKKDIEYEQYVKQFQDEAQRLAKFSIKPHPHIVKVRDYFLEDTLPCLVMDFIKGQTLMEIIKTQGRLSEAQCLIYIHQIGKALETIHQAKMVHRDAHPGNIMIQDDQAILIDFGIARNIIPATHSVTNKAVNPSFAPYEQIYLGSKERQYTIDVYTLAATFYYAVTGKRPTPSMERKLNDNSVLIPPKQINGQLSEHINEAILEGIALEKEDRPQSISAWLGLLEPPQLPPPVSPEYQVEVIKPPGSTQNHNVRRFSNQLRKIPWISLIILFLIYGICGTFAAMGQIPFWAVPVAWAVAMAVAILLVASAISQMLYIFAIASVVALALGNTIRWHDDQIDKTWVSGLNWASTLVWVTAWGVTSLILTYILALAWEWALFIALTGAVAGGVLMNYIHDKLEKENLSLIDQFLILSGVSLSGMGLGYLIGWLIRM
ncbi:MAG: serine/threonine protein kinase [Crocosphaera sp.]